MLGVRPLPLSQCEQGNQRKNKGRKKRLDFIFRFYFYFLGVVHGLANYKLALTKNIAND